MTVHLERLKSSVNLSLNSTNAAVTREIQSDTKFIKHSVANDEVKAMLDWISSLNFLKQQVQTARIHLIFGTLIYAFRMISSSRLGKVLVNGSSNGKISRPGHQKQRVCFGAPESLEQARHS